MSPQSEAVQRALDPPLHARLFWYFFDDPDELSLLRTMVEHCSDGKTIRASIDRLSVYSKISERKIQYLIHGRPGRRRGLLARHILTELAPANPRKHQPAIYRLNESALRMDPRMAQYRDEVAQMVLPGIGKPARVEPAEIAENLHPGAPRAPGSSTRLVPFAAREISGLRHPGAPGAPGCGMAVSDAVPAPGPGNLAISSVGASVSASNVGSSPHPGAPGAPGSNQKGTLVHRVHQPGAPCAPYPLRDPDVKEMPSSTTAESFGAVIRRALASSVGASDGKAVARIIRDCFRVRPDLSAEELAFWIRQKAGSLSWKVENPLGVLIATLPDCFAGQAFEEWRAARAESLSRCPNCRHEQRDWSVACEWCGRRICPACHEVLSEYETSCAGCGRPWSAQA